MITFLLALDWATLHPWRETRNGNKCWMFWIVDADADNDRATLSTNLKESCYQLRYLVTIKSISCVTVPVFSLEEVEVEVEVITGVTGGHPQPEGDTSRYAPLEFVELLKYCSMFLFHVPVFSGGTRAQVHRCLVKKKKFCWEIEASVIFILGMTILIIYSGWIKYQNDLCQSKTVWRNVLLTDNVSVSLDIILSK